MSWRLGGAWHLDHLVANRTHTDEAKEKGRAFNDKKDPDPEKFYR